MVAKIDYDKVARVIADAAIFGDAEAASKNGVSIRSVRNYRSRLETDPQLAMLAQLKRQQQDQAWAHEIPSMISAGIHFLKRATQELNPKDPLCVHAVAGALKIVSEIELSKRMIDARLNQET